MAEHLQHWTCNSEASSSSASSREGIAKKGTTDTMPHRLLDSLSNFSYICLKLRVTKGLVIIYYYSTHSFNLF